MIRIGLIQFPGSNCERETALAVKRAGMEPVEFLWNESQDLLTQMDGFILIGGFSYEDRSRAGIIAALDPVIAVIKIESAKGKPVLGICNGAQILVEAGMVLSIAENQLNMALNENKRIVEGKILGVGFYNAWVNMRLSNKNGKPNAFNRHLKCDDVIHLPIAHAEGRFDMPQSVFNEVDKQGLNLFQYCDEQGFVINNFPINPNGSIGNTAALINEAGNVMAMMPHPERTTNGDPIFSSMRDYISDSGKLLTENIPALKKAKTPQRYQKIPSGYECIVKLVITDNQALTVQNTLRKLGFPVQVNRFVHWEIECDSAETIELIKNSGVLYCDRKEHEVVLSEKDNAASLAYLVRAKDNLRGMEALQTLESNYLVQGVKNINYSVLWQFKSEDAAIHELIDGILLTNIISNPYAHQCYEYEFQG